MPLSGAWNVLNPHFLFEGRVSDHGAIWAVSVGIADRIGGAPDENHFTTSRADDWGYNVAVLEVKKEIPVNIFAGKLGHENLTFGAQCCDTVS